MAPPRNERTTLFRFSFKLFRLFRVASPAALSIFVARAKRHLSHASKIQIKT